MRREDINFSVDFFYILFVFVITATEEIIHSVVELYIFYIQHIILVDAVDQGRLMT